MFKSTSCRTPVLPAACQFRGQKTNTNGRRATLSIANPVFIIASIGIWATKGEIITTFFTILSSLANLRTDRVPCTVGSMKSVQSSEPLSTMARRYFCVKPLILGQLISYSRTMHPGTTEDQDSSNKVCHHIVLLGMQI
jgi:hypothetical protein